MIKKQVRFDTPTRSDPRLRMKSSDIHSPRPFLGARSDTNTTNLRYHYQEVVPFSADPVIQYENSNSVPYPTYDKIDVEKQLKLRTQVSPSSDLELSMFDGPDLPFSCRILGDNIGKANSLCEKDTRPDILKRKFPFDVPVLSSVENVDFVGKPNFLQKTEPKDNGFFMRPDKPVDNLFTISNPSMWSRGIADISGPVGRKLEIMNKVAQKPPIHKVACPTTAVHHLDSHCRCHDCNSKENKENVVEPPVRHFYHGTRSVDHCHTASCCGGNLGDQIVCKPTSPQHIYHTNEVQNCRASHPIQASHFQNPLCNYEPAHCGCKSLEMSPKTKPLNSAEQKTLAIKRFEQKNSAVNNDTCTDVEKPSNLKEKREPTVSDLFKIIKIQNEQLRLLQDKVDKFIIGNNNHYQNTTPKPIRPVEGCVQECVAVETVRENHQMSIGVMTSFEMIRTSTVLNKDVMSNANANVHCNRSQISIKEVIHSSKAALNGNQNFLDGIKPIDANSRSVSSNRNHDNLKTVTLGKDTAQRLNPESDKEGTINYPDNANDEKTLNELSLCNLQIDNATTPQLSPDQTLYLDVRDYSDSDSDEKSNVGWTYYNKVMTHVNGMLQDSQMPSSAGALYRKAGRCTRMHVDRTDVSVTCKRVQFGEMPLEQHQRSPFTTPSSDTSMKMNQLAAKYLKASQLPAMSRPTPRTSPGVDMSFATRNYMEKHKLLQGGQPTASGVPTRFLDITALKQQPKLL